MAKKTDAIEVLKMSVTSGGGLFGTLGTDPAATYITTTKPWLYNFLTSAAMTAGDGFTNNAPFYFVLVVESDTEHLEKDLVKFVKDLVNNTDSVLNSSLHGFTCSRVSSKEAATVFTGGNVKLFKDLLDNLRDQNDLV